MGESALVRALPRYDVVERHARLVRASPAATDAAFRALTLREVPAMAVLFAARSLPDRLLSGRGLPSGGSEPLLQQLLDGGFRVLVDRPGEEIVVGLIAQMWRPGGRVMPPEGMSQFIGFGEPGFAKAALSFAVLPEGAGTRAVTETRVLATDAAARRAFGRYWRVIGPFSGLVRRIWLRGVAARAEQTSGG